MLLENRTAIIYLEPVGVATRTAFLTWRAAARHLPPGGVILAFGGTGAPMAGLGGTQIAFAAVEAMRQQWSLELAPRGIRVVTLQTAGVPESIADPELRERIAAGAAELSPLGRAAQLEDVGRLAAFLASDHARTITGTEVNMTCGTMID